MKQRILVAIIGVPALIGVLCFAPDWATAVLVAALCKLCKLCKLCTLKTEEAEEAVKTLESLLKQCCEVVVVSELAGNQE